LETSPAVSSVKQAKWLVRLKKRALIERGVKYNEAEVKKLF
jgi:hypothetical protein